MAVLLSIPFVPPGPLFPSSSLELLRILLARRAPRLRLLLRQHATVVDDEGALLSQVLKQSSEVGVRQKQVYVS